MWQSLGCGPGAEDAVRRRMTLEVVSRLRDALGATRSLANADARAKLEGFLESTERDYADVFRAARERAEEQRNAPPDEPEAA